MKHQERRHRQFVSSDGVRIWYQVQGRGPLTLVLCDGLACTGYIWKHFLPHFAQGFQLIHSHYRGHGRSDTPPDLAALTVERLSLDIIELLEHLRPEGPVIFVGHSMGVQVALESYRQAAHWVQGLILINGPAGEALRHVHNTPIFADALPTIDRVFQRFKPYIQKIWRPLLDSELSYIYARWFEVNPWLARRQDFRVYFRDLGSMDPSVYLAVVRAATEHTAESLLSTIDVPTLVVAGDKDRFTPYAVCLAMQRAIPGAELMTMPTGSHIGPLELPEFLHLRIEKFLTKHTATLQNLEQRHRRRKPERETRAAPKVKPVRDGKRASAASPRRKSKTPVPR